MEAEKGVGLWQDAGVTLLSLKQWAAAQQAETPTIPSQQREVPHSEGDRFPDGTGTLAHRELFIPGREFWVQENLAQLQYLTTCRRLVNQGYLRVSEE